MDNLKLGYGGTKTEMQRLINDANEVKRANGEMADLSIDSFASIVEAIHIVQTEMGITGTTALEASETISGSVASMKAAWQNLLTAIADEQSEWYPVIDAFVESVATAANNIIPIVEIALEGIGLLIEELAPIIIEKLPSVVETVIPSLLSAATRMVNSVVKITPSLVSEIVSALIDSAPLLIESGIALIDSLIQAFSDSKDTIVDGAFQIINMLIVAIGDLLPDLVDLGGDLLISIINGIIENLPTWVETALTLIEKLASGVTQYLPKLSETFIGLIKYIVSVLTDDKNLDVIFDSALAIILSLAEFIVDVLPELVDASVQIISKLVEYLLDPQNLAEIITAAIQIIAELGKGLTENAGQIFKGVANLVISIVESLFETDWLEVGKDIGTSILRGILDVFGVIEDLEKWEKEKNPFVYMDPEVIKNYKPKKDITDLLPTKVEEEISSLPPLEYTPSWDRELSQKYPIVVQNIYSQAQTAADLAQETQWEARRTWISEVGN